MASVVKAMVVCLQETKLQQINESMVSELLGTRFKNNYSFLTALCNCGGILITASDDHFNLMSVMSNKILSQLEYKCSMMPLNGH
jgi:hypothetical protein